MYVGYTYINTCSATSIGRQIHVCSATSIGRQIHVITLETCSFTRGGEIVLRSSFTI